VKVKAVIQSEGQIAGLSRGIQLQHSRRVVSLTHNKTSPKLYLATGHWHRPNLRGSILNQNKLHLDDRQKTTLWMSITDMSRSGGMMPVVERELL
jgi:hypothetical protein